MPERNSASPREPLALLVLAAAALTASAIGPRDRTNPAPQEPQPIRIAGVEIPVAEQTPLVLSLLAIIQRQEQELQGLRDEIQRLKGTTQRPKISPSQLLKPPPQPDREGKRPGSAKRSMTKDLKIDETIVLPPETLPADARLEGYRDFVVQDLVVKTHTTRYRRAVYRLTDGRLCVAPRPAGVDSHFVFVVLALEGAGVLPVNVYRGLGRQDQADGGYVLRSFLALADCLYRAQRYRDADEVYTRAVKRFPLDARSQWALCRIAEGYQKAGVEKSDIELLKQLQASAPGDTFWTKVMGGRVSSLEREAAGRETSPPVNAGGKGG